MGFNFNATRAIGLVMMVLIWVGCGRKKTGSDQVPSFSETMEIPSYQDNSQGNYAADLTKLTEATIKVQDVGAKLASYWASKLIIKNSWGSTWGYSGLAMATYEWVQKSLLDAVAITEIGSE